MSKFIELTLVEDTGSYEEEDQQITVNLEQIVSLKKSSIMIGSYHGRKSAKVIKIKTTNGTINVKETIEYILNNK